MKIPRASVLLACCIALPGCMFGRFFTRNMEVLVSTPQRVENKLTQPVRDDVGIAILWVGHATVLVQMDDKLILTDPVFTDTVGQISKRIVEPGIEPAKLPRLDLAVVSHMHFDHLSLGTLALLEDKIGLMAIPWGGLVYLTDFDFPVAELEPWHSRSVDGLKVTAVPVEHKGWRYGLDITWANTAYTGFVFEYHGLTVYFGGDSAYAPELFRETAVRFPSIDVALIPVAPINPREFMKQYHLDPAEALDAFALLGARHMVPIHYDTFYNSSDALGFARNTLIEEIRARGLERRVSMLKIGEQRVFDTQRGPRNIAHLREPHPE